MTNNDQENRINDLQSEKNHFEQTTNDLAFELDETRKLIEQIRKALVILNKRQSGEIVDDKEFEAAKKLLAEQCSLGMLRDAFDETRAQEEATAKTPQM